MMSSSDTKNAMQELWMTLAPQSGPMVVTSKLSASQPNWSATLLAAAAALSADVSVVRTRKPAWPSESVVCTTASGSPASAKAERTCSVVTSLPP